LWNKYPQALHKHGIPQKQWRWMVRWVQNYIRQVTQIQHSETYENPYSKKKSFSLFTESPAKSKFFRAGTGERALHCVYAVLGVRVLFIYFFYCS
jgi:hypothetical protein